jgi:hypothetical protein
VNYNKIYDQLINKAQNRKLTGYIERHHILPRSMGGRNHKDNLVDLTAREHLLAHMLLWRIHRNTSMSYALWLMSNTRGIKLNSRMYESLRLNVSNLVSKQMSEKIITNETRNKMSASLKGRVFTSEHRQKISNSRKGVHTIPKGYKFNFSEEDIKKRSESRKGKYTGDAHHMKLDEHRDRQRNISNSPEVKQKFMERMIGHKPFNFRRVSANGIEYESAVACAKALDVTYNWLMRRIKMEKYPDYFYIT